jgi:hypothetical protein
MSSHVSPSIRVLIKLPNSPFSINVQVFGKNGDLTP